jgi:hypothetical protein
VPSSLFINALEHNGYCMYISFSVIGSVHLGHRVYLLLRMIPRMNRDLTFEVFIAVLVHIVVIWAVAK